MSLDVKDFRRFKEGKLAEEAAKEDIRPKHLLQQVKIADETGDPRLDKLMRTLAHEIEKLDAEGIQIADEAMRCPDDRMMVVKQKEFLYKRGQKDALLGVMQLPAQIILEEQGVSAKSDLIQ